MNTFKRSLAMMLVLCMLFSMAPITAFAEGTADPAGTVVPAADQPAADQPAADQPAADQPAADQPVADQPAADQPAADQPAADQPAADQPAADQPAADQPVADQPAADKPAADQPAADQPAADQPAADQPAADQPAADQPAADQPAANQPAANQPAANQPAANQPAADQPAADQPVADQPAVDQPAADQPAAGEAEKDPYGIALTAEDPYGVATAAVEPVTGNLSYASDYRILHLDCGRKYFTKDWIIALINEMEAAGYTHLELAFGNDGLRFLLDDMSVGAYSDDQVTAAIQAGNKTYYDFGTNELTEAEMDAIISHANSKGIKIIPLLNNPGHMDAIVSAVSSLLGSSVGYDGSSSTVDLENTEAVAIVEDLVEKYVAYFDGMGCNEFNFGADEYANDVYSTGSMGFGNLYWTDKNYQLFVNYVNEMAAMIKGYGMVPIAFNDGIYFNQDTSYNFDTQIAVAFWTSGWTGYQSASASTMESMGHKMINVNGDYYYVLGKSDQWDSIGYTYAANWNNSTFMGSTVSNPMGGMFCIWCDYPGAESEIQIAANTRMILRAMAAEMQGEDGTAVSDEVIPGGFNEDGTIAEDCNNVTVKDETATGDAAKVEVTGCDLTSVTVTEATAPAIADTADVIAWDITPYAGEAKYEGGATVKLPVPADWNTSLVKGFYVENGQAVVVEDSPCADGFCTFTMPHFSVGGLMLLDASTAYDQLIELNVGESKTVLIEGVDLTGNTYSPAPEGIASVSVKGNSAVTGTTVSTTKATTLENGATYILRVYDTNYALSSDTGRSDWSTKTLAFQENNLTADAKHMWTLENVDGGYKLKNASGYLNLGTGNNTAYLNDTGEVFTITNTDTGWTIGNQSGRYINALGGLDSYYTAGGWTGDGTRFDLYKVTEATDASTTVTFTGDAAGETFVTINDVTYKIIVHGTVPITITYQTEDGTVIKTETVTVADNATTYTVSNFTNTDGKFYVVDNTTLNITPATVTKYTVTVTETEEDLSQVSDLTVEYFITNQRVSINNVTQETISATEVYSENGAAFADLVPASNGADNPKVFWKGWLLPDGYHQEGDETGTGPADRCTDANGTLIERIRYWNGEWAYYNGTEWTAIKSTDQIVAYYLQQTAITDEVTTNVTDWGETYADWKNNSNSGHWFWQNYVENGLKYVFMDFAVVYQDGTQTPATSSFPVDDTWFFHFDGCSETNPRILKPISFDETGDYEIWKVTITDGTSSGYSSASSFTSTYDDSTETTVWSEEMGGTPHIDSISYTANQSGKLVRIYVRAVAKEDSLTVIYYDEKFGDTLYTYNISVESGRNFNDHIVNANGEIADPGYLSGSTSRLDVSGYGIVNALNKTQYFQTDLTQIPEAVGKYNNALYAYTGSVISEDGKTLYLYYNINTDILSPNFVADFGLPLSFPLSIVVGGEDQTELVEAVTVKEKTKYGTLSYDSATKHFTYTPTEVLQNIDVLTITLTIAGKTSTTNVGVTPATTVYYGEKFLNFSDGWTSVGTYANVGEQKAEVLGESTYYGYDAAYAATTGASDGTASKSVAIGDRATFTFTGTGIQVFANASDSTGYVSVMVKNKDTGAIANVSMVDTVVNGTASTETTGGQIGKNLSGLPVVSLVDLTGLAHATYEVTISKIMDEDPVFIDGIRVFGTLDESKYTTDTNPYTDDEEDAPSFYEVRDMVLSAIDIAPSESADYETLYKQIYAGTIAAGARAVITNAGNPYGEGNRQDLLDNGPKNELYLFPGDTLTFNVQTDRVVQLGLKAPEGSASYKLNGAQEATDLETTVDMFYKVAEKNEATDGKTITVENAGTTILSVTLLKVCDDPNFAFIPLTEANIKQILANAGVTETPQQPTYTMVELKGTDVLIDGTVFDYTGEAIEPAITVNVNGVQLVEGKDYSVTYTNNVEPGTATVTVRGIATASETLGYTGEVSIDFTINAPAEPEVPEETTKPAKPGQGNKPNQDNKPGQGNNKPSQDNKPGQGNKPGQNNSVKKATLKITFVNLMGKKVSTATIAKTGAANEYGVFSAQEICEQAPAHRHAVWFLPAIVPYGTAASIVVPVI